MTDISAIGNTREGAIAKLGECIIGMVWEHVRTLGYNKGWRGYGDGKAELGVRLGNGESFVIQAKGGGIPVEEWFTMFLVEDDDITTMGAKIAYIPCKTALDTVEDHEWWVARTTHVNANVAISAAVAALDRYASEVAGSDFHEGKIKVDYINHMGDDITVANAARVSMAKESDYNYVCVGGHGLCATSYPSDDCPHCEKRLPEKDERLIRYLARHNHWTPFGHPQVEIRETVPIFVARQRMRSNIGIVYNETSRRYVDEPPEYWFPKVWRVRAENVKQGSGGAAPDDINAKADKIARHAVAVANEAYLKLLDLGIAPEMARIILPLNMMTQYTATSSLAAMARIYNLRKDSHAQSEIRDLADQWGHIMEGLFPASWKALTDEEESDGSS